jgi:cytochrome oxidase Cu insertion factor (SCO1/SenC/PrrC family)
VAILKLYDNWAIAEGTAHRAAGGGREMKMGIVMLGVLALAASPIARAGREATKVETPAVGLEVGQKAPAFSGTDQFGHEQTNESLKGSNGTVILFFRSADW